MSVFTPVSDAQARAFLADYALGELCALRGIEEGIENSNFFLDTSQGRYVLTLFERTPEQDLPYFLGVMAHLSAAGIPCAQPMADRHGSLLKRLNGRAATIVQRLSGAAVTVPDRQQCASLGKLLGRMHLAAQDFAPRRPNCRGPQWWAPAEQRLRPVLAAQDAQLLRDEIDWQSQQRISLPQGVIHADLFRDNALFQDGQISGVIDFYYACNGPWLYDLAVAVNDWTINPSGAVDGAAMDAMLAAYVAARPLVDAERAAWTGQLRAAALRFWVSRLLDWHFPRPGELTYAKNPNEFRDILCLHREQPRELPG